MIKYHVVNLNERNDVAMDFIEFLVKAINEEASDAGKYMQWAGAC